MKMRSQLAISMLIFSLTTACTKKRDPALPAEAVQTTFAISEFGSVEPETNAFSFGTLTEPQALTDAEKAQALNEKGTVVVDNGGVKVSERLRFMFQGLRIQGAAGKRYSLVFGVDADYVTAYKIVTNPSDLTVLEKATTRNLHELQGELALSKTGDNSKLSSLRTKILEAANIRRQAIQNNQTDSYFVPIFRYKVKSFGVIERKKNELKEATAVLQLQATPWSEATHVQLSIDERETAFKKEDAREVFNAAQVHNQVLTVAQLKTQYNVKSTLADTTKVVLQIEGDSLVVSEISTKQKAGDQAGVCTDEIKSKLLEADRAECALIRQSVYAVTYVRPVRPDLGVNDARSSETKFEAVSAQESVGLIRIARDSQARSVTKAGPFDGRLLKKSDWNGKTFLLSRSIEESTSSTLGQIGASKVEKVTLGIQGDRLVAKNAKDEVLLTLSLISLHEREDGRGLESVAADKGELATFSLTNKAASLSNELQKCGRLQMQVVVETNVQAKELQLSLALVSSIRLESKDGCPASEAGDHSIKERISLQSK